MIRFRDAALGALGVVAAMVGLAASASAQGYDGPRSNGYGARAYQPYEAPPPRMRARPADPYYGNAPTVRKYGHGPSRHWRRWTRHPHPAWRDTSLQYGQGWGRPRYFDYR